MESLPTISTGGHRVQGGEQRCKSAEQEPAATTLERAHGAKFKQHRSRTAYWVNFQKKLRGKCECVGNLTCWGSTGVDHELGVQSKNQKEKKINIQGKNTGLAL